MRRLHELCEREYIRTGEDRFLIPGGPAFAGQKVRVHILAMGDVGGTLALAMKLTGADVLSGIGICDINERMLARWEQELNQIVAPADPEAFPPVCKVSPEQLFDCDAFVFCASRGVPDLSEKNVDVRMVQLEKNAEMIAGYGRQAAEAGFRGAFFVVSDPVDPLCAAAAKAGVCPDQIQGFGLGVMNGRAAYYAAGDERMASYRTEGRVFGPHGEDLVVANSIRSYNDDLSRELTRMTVNANRQIRELGFKPYIAPAVSSGALSILENLRGGWHYSSVCFGGAFLGLRNRRTDAGIEVEDQPLDEKLFARIETAYRNLEGLL
ncbi:MAG: lactate dehydrogenase [Firmicutes bacterium]|nr:lactate dehydrogenase [Bacillota bacterium]